MGKTKSKPCDFVIFGALGDLCRRKLITSLYHLERVGLIDAATRIIGVARRNETTETFIVRMRESLDLFLKWNFDEAVWQRLSARLTYVNIDMAKSEEYKKLCGVVDQQARV
ncbi:MAG: glucose-6-phosphate dehydrogenase, partial [Desulfobulbaceae bacterium]|nr:glucose-6-phosphate dehydrogenase [Desulfobulbaceae bacterium]